MRLVAWILAAVVAAGGIYLIVIEANPLWTLGAGIAVGGLVTAARGVGEGPPKG